MSNMIRSQVQQSPVIQQKQDGGGGLDWLKPIGTVASMFGFPYLSMALGASDLFQGDISGLGGLFGAGGSDNPLLKMLLKNGQFNPYAGFAPKAFDGFNSNTFDSAGGFMA